MKRMSSQQGWCLVGGVVLASLEHLGEIQVEGKWTTTDHETCTRAKK